MTQYLCNACGKPIDANEHGKCFYLKFTNILGVIQKERKIELTLTGPNTGDLHLCRACLCNILVEEVK
jgi:hypothetical protein